MHLLADLSCPMIYKFFRSAWPGKLSELLENPGYAILAYMLKDSFKILVLNSVNFFFYVVSLLDNIFWLVLGIIW